jgi:hypothetical protein
LFEQGHTVEYRNMKLRPQTIPSTNNSTGDQRVGVARFLILISTVGHCSKKTPSDNSCIPTPTNPDRSIHYNAITGPDGMTSLEYFFLMLYTVSLLLRTRQLTFNCESCFSWSLNRNPHPYCTGK